MEASDVSPSAARQERLLFHSFARSSPAVLSLAFPLPSPPTALPSSALRLIHHPFPGARLRCHCSLHTPHADRGPSSDLLSLLQTFRGKTEEEKVEGKKQVADAVETLEGALRECSNGEGFFGGDNAGLVDISLGSLLLWLSATELMSRAKTFDPAKTPLLAAWRSRFVELNAAKEAIPEVERVVEFAKKRQVAQVAAATASDN